MAPRTRSTAQKAQKKKNRACVEMILMMRRRDRHFRSICSQLVLMNNHIREIRARYDRAVKNQRHSFKYTQKVRLVTMEGVRNMFTDFAHAEADKLDALEEVLWNEHSINWADVSEEVEED